LTDLPSRLAEFGRRRPRVVCLPDFFVDHSVALPPFGQAMKRMRAVHGRGGGSWVGVRQRYLPGGNAGNAARGLAALGARAHLIARTDAFGAAFARATLGAEGVDVSRVRDDGRVGTTTALEFQPGPTNVMLNEPGSIADFGPEQLRREDRELIEGADAVFVGNWAQTGDNGMRLAERVLAWAHAAGALTFLDTSDATALRKHVPTYRRRVLESRNLDVFAANDNELRLFGGAGPIPAVGTRLAARLHATLDVHTPTTSATWTGQGVHSAPGFKVRPLRSTGAGDAWNAGDLVGHLLELEPADRLRVANATAALYISSESGAAPTMRNVASFLRRRGARSAR